MNFEKLKSIREYWNNNSFKFERISELSRTLPDIQGLIKLMNGSFENEIWKKSLSVMINASRVQEDGNHQQFLSIDPKASSDYFNSGFTLCFGDLSNLVKSIGELKIKAGEFFGYEELISVTSYLSPPNSIGVLHFDRQHNFFIQKEGKKKWFISEKPGVKNPYENLVYNGMTENFFEERRKLGYNIKLPRECGMRTFEINPGDILYVPPGFYHSSENSNAPSLHYTLTIEPACYWKTLNKFMFDKLLSNTDCLYEDFRFLDLEERKKLLIDCLNKINLDSLR